MHAILSTLFCSPRQPAEIDLSNFARSADRLAKQEIGKDPKFTKKCEWGHFFSDLSVSTASPEQLAGVLETLAAGMTAGLDDGEDPGKSIDRLLELAPIEMVEQALQDAKDGKPFDPTNSLKRLQVEARTHKKSRKDSLPPDLEKRLYSAWKAFSSALFTVLENGVMTMGFSELLKPVEGATQQMMKMNKMMIALNIYQALATAMMLWLGAQWGSAIFGVTLTTMIILSVAYNKIKPAPDTLPPSTRNLSREYDAGKLPHVEVPQEILEKAAAVYTSKSRDNVQHIMFIGYPGVGKTSVLYALARAFREGRFGEECKHIDIHLVDGASMRAADATADMFGGASSILDKIMLAIGSDKNCGNTIYAIDEIHELWRGAETSENGLGSQLKNKLSGGGKFPKVVGATTWKDYGENMGSDQALFRRFRFIEVKDLSREAVLRILREGLPAPKMVQPGALEHLYDEVDKEYQRLQAAYQEQKSKMKDAPEGTKGPTPPLPRLIIAKQLLDGCLTHIEKSVGFEVKWLERWQREIDAYQAGLSSELGSAIEERQTAIVDQLELLEQEGETSLPGRMAGAKQRREAFDKANLRWRSIMPRLYRRALQMPRDLDGASLSVRERRQICKLELMRRFFEGASETHANARAQQINLDQQAEIKRVLDMHLNPEKTIELALALGIEDNQVGKLATALGFDGEGVLHSGEASSEKIGEVVEEIGRKSVELQITTDLVDRIFDEQQRTYAEIRHKLEHEGAEKGVIVEGLMEEEGEV